jgi:hypothetical protein
MIVLIFVDRLLTFEFTTSGFNSTSEYYCFSSEDNTANQEDYDLTVACHCEIIAPACSNRIDDDGDGFIDLEDDGCFSEFDTSEKMHDDGCDSLIDMAE